jgi:alkylation response protein AidB-like acyl-CoA dehydrogenase
VSIADITRPFVVLNASQPCSLSTEEILERATEVADFCSAHAAAIDHQGMLPVEEFDHLRRSGLLTVPLRQALGGAGVGIEAEATHTLLRLLRQIGRGNLAVGRIYEGHINGLQLVQTFGTQEQIEQYASDVRDRHKVFGVWNAEASDGVRLIPLEGGRYRLEGSKTFCSGVGCVDRPFVNGALPDGRWQMCVVPLDEVVTHADPSWWQPPGMKATASYKVDFSGVELDARSLIGNPDDYHRQPWLSGGAIRFAAVQLGGAEALFDETRKYLQGLKRTSDPYQAARLGQMAIALESGNLWLQGAAAQLAQYAPTFGGNPDEEQPEAIRIIAYANMMRTAIEQICMDMMQLCERSVGTRGLMPPYPIERIVRDLTLYLRQPNFDAVLANVGEYALNQNRSAEGLWKTQEN